MQWECILYRYLAEVAGLGRVTVTGARSCPELCSRRVKSWEAGFSLLSNCCQPELKLLQSAEMYDHEASLLVWNLVPEGMYVSK